eukprot:403367032
MKQAVKQSSNSLQIYELNINNADKGLIDDEALSNRINQFQHANLNLLVTCKSYFVEKAKLLPNCTFILGYDTFIRVVDLKYYQHSMDEYIKILQIFRDNHTKFLVGGRLNPNTQIFEELNEQIIVERIG